LFCTLLTVLPIINSASSITNACGDSYQFFNVLTSDSLLDTVEALLRDHRERVYPPTETLSMFLAQGMAADRSCQAIVNQSAVKRLAGG